MLLMRKSPKLSRSLTETSRKLLCTMGKAQLLMYFSYTRMLNALNSLAQHICTFLRQAYGFAHFEFPAIK